MGGEKEGEGYRFLGMYPLWVPPTGSYSDTPYSDSYCSDNSYSAAKVFMQVMFVTVTVPLGVTLYASCVGHFSMFTSAQLRLSVTHCCSTVPVL